MQPAPTQHIYTHARAMRPERALWTEQTKKERRSEVGKINGGDGDAYDELEELVGEEERELQWTEEARGGS